jgi:hypothetical protein
MWRSAAPARPLSAHPGQARCARPQVRRPDLTRGRRAAAAPSQQLALASSRGSGPRSIRLQHVLVALPTTGRRPPTGAMMSSSVMFRSGSAQAPLLCDRRSRARSSGWPSTRRGGAARVRIGCGVGLALTEQRRCVRYCPNGDQAVHPLHPAGPTSDCTTLQPPPCVRSARVCCLRQTSIRVTPVSSRSGKSWETGRTVVPDLATTHVAAREEWSARRHWCRSSNAPAERRMERGPLAGSRRPDRERSGLSSCHTTSRPC